MKCLDKTFYPSSHFKSTRQYLNLRSTAVSCQTHACVFKSATTSAGSMLTDCLNIWTGNELLPPLPPPSPWGYNSAAIEYRDTSRTHARIPVHASTHTGARKGRTHTCAHRHTDARKGRTHTHTHACALRSQHNNTAHWVPHPSNYYLLCCSSLTKNTHLRLKWDRGVFLFSWKF